MAARKRLRSRSESELSPAKRRLFVVVMALVPVLFFLLLEGGLRLWGYGRTYPLFVQLEQRPAFQHINPEVARRYFAQLEWLPTGLVDYFAVQKRPSTFRIFVHGGSTAAGFPFYQGAAFSRMLHDRLERTFPDREIEVVNTALTAINSYTLLDFSDEVLSQEPDAILIYAGHNEFYGALGVASREAVVRSVALTRLYLRLQSLRTVQLLRNLIAGLIPRSSGEPSSATLMEWVVRDQHIPYGSSLYRQGLRQFEANLSSLFRKYRRHDVPVFIATIAANERDHPPFMTGLSPETDVDEWEGRRAEVVRILQTGDHEEALRRARELVAFDSTSADAHYLLGTLLDRRADYEAARDAYVEAKDRDLLRFRASEDVNAIIRRLAEHHGAVVVEAQQALRDASPGGIIGADLMTEHLHPNVDGYFVIADAFYEALRAEGVVGPWTSPVTRAEARADVVLTQVDSLVGAYWIERLTSAWPFVSRERAQPYRPPESTNEIERIAQERFVDSIEWTDGIERLRQWYESQRDWDGVLKTEMAYARQYRVFPEPYVGIGEVLVRLERYGEALPYFRRANALAESAHAHTMIGAILLQHAEREEAVLHLERAVAMDSGNAQALYNLALAYAMGGEHTQAREVAERLLTVPAHADRARSLLAGLPRG